MLRGELDPGQRWTRRDALLAQALTEFEAMLCAGCGQPRHLSMDVNLQMRWQAQLPMRCHACTEQLRQASGYAEQDYPQALHFPVVLSDRSPLAGSSTT